MGKILNNFLILIIGSLIIWFGIFLIFKKEDEEAPIEDEQVVAIFGEGASASVDEVFVSTTTVTAKELVYIDEQVVGYLYTIVGEAEYFGGETDEISFKIALDSDLKLIGNILIYYGHSGGIHKTHVLNFLESLTGVNISELVELDGQGGSTTAPTTTSLLISMLYDLKDVVLDN